ncbi:MAG: hypothetical protein FJ255_03875 [Phycisphaerae bacterium]|nr:hypothetical protein [Phycisphaerae bacterium]
MRRTWSLMLVLGAVAGLQACRGGPPPRPRAVTPSVIREVPSLLRGTVGSETTMNGAEPTLVSGYGLVVGLRGTGGLPLPPSIQATMERELGLRGVSRTSDAFRGTPLHGLTPQQVLRSPEVGVVEVWSAIPPGAPLGARFDVGVRAVNASSLEGGQLWSTDLRLSPPGQPLAFGQVQTRKLAEARGAVFVNPFTEAGGQAATPTVTGRILNGGTVTDPMLLELALDTPSHARARAIAAAIAARFPEEPGDGGSIARGRNESSISLRVPRSFRERPAEFLDIVRNLPIHTLDPETVARSAVEGVKREAALANEMSWMMVSAGPKGLRIIRELYDFAEPVPRLAGLAAGARLNDPVAVEPLIEITRRGPGLDRLRAIELLARIDAGPRVDAALRPLLGEPDLPVRVTAYEALVDRAVKARLVRLLDADATRGPTDGPPRTLNHLEVLSQQSVPAGAIQGVERRLVEGRFFLDLVPVGDPLIYVSQQGSPRIVVFGAAVSLNAPAILTMWDDRLAVSTESPTGQARLMHRDPQTGVAGTETVGMGLPEVLDLLGRVPVPEDARPGFGLTYSEVVSAAYTMQQHKVVEAAFATEQDRLRAQMLAATRSQEVRLRPETSADEYRVIRLDAGTASAAPVEPSGPPKPRLIPIVPPAGATPKG